MDGTSELGRPWHVHYYAHGGCYSCQAPFSLLLARIYEAFPLLCPICHAEMRIIAFINEAATVTQILEHIGEATQPPRIAPARGPPLLEAAEPAGNDPQWDASAQPAPEFEFDQRIVW